jgi:hypothetical protein
VADWLTELKSDASSLKLAKFEHGPSARPPWITSVRHTRTTARGRAPLCRRHPEILIAAHGIPIDRCRVRTIGFVLSEVLQCQSLGQNVHRLGNVFALQPVSGMLAHRISKPTPDGSGERTAGECPRTARSNSLSRLGIGVSGTFREYSRMAALP